MRNAKIILQIDKRFRGYIAKRPPRRFYIRYVVAIENINVWRYGLNGGFRVCYQPPFYDYLVALLPLDLPLSG